MLDNFRLTITEGEIVAVVGPSGSGKSTLLNALAGLTESELRGHRPFREPVGYAFQRAYLAPWRTAAENAFLDVDHLGMAREHVVGDARELTALVGLSSYAGALPYELSAGMQQRIQLVRVLTAPARLYLLDEPLSAVDQPLKIALAQAIRTRLKSRSAAAIWVTHDSREAVEVADRVLILAGRPLSAVQELSVERSAENSRDSVGSDAARTSGGSLDDQAAAVLKRLGILARQEETAPGSVEASVGGRTPLRRLLRAGESLIAAVPIVLLLTAWELSVRVRPGLEFFIGRPTVVIDRLIDGLTNGTLLEHIAVTAREAGAGLAMGVPLGLIVGFAAALSDTVMRALRPYLAGMTAIPLFVLAPAFILWFGVGEGMKMVLASVSCFPVVAYLVMEGAMAAKSDYFRLMKVQGAPWSRLFRHSLLPGSLEAVIRSLRPAAVAALIGAFLGEFIAANRGLGYMIILESSRYRISEVLGGVAVLFMLAVVTELIATALARRSVRIVSYLRL